MCAPSLGHFGAPPVILDLKPDLRSHYRATRTKKTTSRGHCEPRHFTVFYFCSCRDIWSLFDCKKKKKEKEKKGPTNPTPEILKTARRDSCRSRIPGAVGQSVAVFTFHERWKWKQEREGGAGGEREQEGEVWRECGSKRRGERKQSLTLLTVTSLVYKPTRGYGIRKKKNRVDFSRVILIVSSCGVSRWEQIERSFWEKRGGEKIRRDEEMESRKSEHFFMIRNENISLDQSVIASRGGGGRETCTEYFRLTDWLIGLL